jgi:hypothetical protein
MLVVYRLAGLSALEAYYAEVVALAQCGSRRSASWVEQAAENRPKALRPPEAFVDCEDEPRDSVRLPVRLTL